LHFAPVFALFDLLKRGDAAIFHFEHVVGHDGVEEDKSVAFGSFNCWNIANPPRISTVSKATEGETQYR